MLARVCSGATSSLQDIVQDIEAQQQADAFSIGGYAQEDSLHGLGAIQSLKQQSKRVH